MLIGIISDTHAYFDPQIAQCFAQVEHIIHAGDIGAELVVTQLEHIALVVGVCTATWIDLR